MVKVIKKDGTISEFHRDKIVQAITKSSERVLIKLTENEVDTVISKVLKALEGKTEIDVATLHNLVEASLDKVSKEVARSYREYRNYKTDFVGMLDEIYKKAQTINYIGDKENSNTDSALVTTKRSLIYNELNKELYRKFFLSTEELQACNEGFIYVHDQSARRDAINCCLFNAKSVMSGGFEMGNLWYNEPKSVDTACDVLGDVIMMSASMQYGGWSTRVDDLLAPYAEKSYEFYKNQLKNYGILSEKFIETEAMALTRRDLAQGIQGLEYKLNSVASSRGDYPFTTFALGLGRSKFERMVSEVVLEVRMRGQGREGYKKPVLFPKLVFLYDENLHGEGKELEYLFNLGVLCSSKAMYPDFLSLTGEGYVPHMYKLYGKVIYPMGQQLVA